MIRDILDLFDSGDIETFRITSIDGKKYYINKVYYAFIIQGLKSNLFYKTITAFIKGKKRHGRIYSKPFFSTFNGTKYDFHENGTYKDGQEKTYELGRTYHNYGNDQYKAEVEIIKNYKVKDA